MWVTIGLSLEMHSVLVTGGKVLRRQQSYCGDRGAAEGKVAMQDGPWWERGPGSRFGIRHVNANIDR